MINNHSSANIDVAARMADYAVAWDTPSRDSSGSMPLGNGEVGLNVWVEENRDLMFYISRTDSWSETMRLLKLGGVRIGISPNPFKKGMCFKQILDLYNGQIIITAGSNDDLKRISIWVDANNDVIRVEVTGDKPFDIRANAEIWRCQDKPANAAEQGNVHGSHAGVESADVVASESDDTIIWYHRNKSSAWADSLKLQCLETMIPRLEDPLINRTFGAAMRGDGLVSSGPRGLVSNQSRTSFTITIDTLTAQTKTQTDWLKTLGRQIQKTDNTDSEKALTAHIKWWNGFWNRSYIFINGSEEAETVTRGYLLQRFMNACGGRGAYPIKFNGSIFTVDAREKGEEFNADYRRWGGCYWFQNTRFAYWPMLQSGDFEMMLPFFRMYVNMIPLAKERTRIYYNHDGIFFPETISIWGCHSPQDYGMNREGLTPDVVCNPYVSRYWQGALEISAMMLDYYDYTNDEDFAKELLVPLISEVLNFYNQHYKRDENGKIRFEPAQSLETWQKAVNPLPEIAGLYWIIEKMLQLPDNLSSPRQKAEWKKLISELPEMPIKVENGKKALAAAYEILEEARNMENPELYAIFPYRIYGVGKPDIEIAQTTYDARKQRFNMCWQQDAIQSALLGRTGEARRMVVERFSKKHDGSRFPAFWGPNFDWIPDMDHGNVAVTALQYMLLQSDGEKPIAAPAWPKEWNADFKLCAPNRTTISGSIKDGALTQY